MSMPMAVYLKLPFFSPIYLLVESIRTSFHPLQLIICSDFSFLKVWVNDIVKLSICLMMFENFCMPRVIALCKFWIYISVMF